MTALTTASQNQPVFHGTQFLPVVTLFTRFYNNGKSSPATEARRLALAPELPPHNAALLPLLPHLYVLTLLAEPEPQLFAR